MRLYKNKLFVGYVCLSVCRVTSCHHVVIKLVVVMFVMTMTSLKVFKKIVQRQIFNCKKIVDGKIFNRKMTEEPTRATDTQLSSYVMSSCRHVVMKLVVVMFVMTMRSLKVFKKIVLRQILNCKKIVDGKMFNCKMTEEPTEESQEQQENRLAADRESKRRKRAEESQEQQENRLAADRESKKRKRDEEPQQQCERLSAKRESEKRRRAEESQEQRENRLAASKDNAKRKRAEESEQPENYRLAFRYSPVDDYSLSRCVQIGTMFKICPYCNALKFNGETMGMCCASGKVKLPLLAAPPEPLKTFLTGTTSESKRFLSQIRKYNSCFQMTSFGAQIENPDQFMSTFKVKGQIYHRAGSLLPFSGENHKFLQLYFISDEILQLLLQGQSAVHRHDITARVFRQKLKSLINYIVKLEGFGSVRCWMYSVEWQKRGLPHAHILIWLHKKIISNEIDDVISGSAFSI